jgi:hypothetical protein
VKDPGDNRPLTRRAGSTRTNGRPWFTKQRQIEQHILVEQVGEKPRDDAVPAAVKIQTEEPVSVLELGLGLGRFVP